ncbi:hypothetical protein OG909_30195 [Streptomyces sp. NBC_01754]|uniref:hypothetical protein n=1 Tax=Streptomyces sp. NBC_01754 TaxID=2975930 RepID=UPI002DDAE5CB|nr:hypothetical protein [Streptomyces sp. NBC_01754]WSC96228.1 hypothetical protein OG909_30195 [Streptomyces sp. NBC_01754]
MNATSPPAFTDVEPGVTDGAEASATSVTGSVASAPAEPAPARGAARAPRPSVAPAASEARRPSRGREAAVAGAGV